MAKRGRKRVFIEWEKVDRLLKAGCNGVQVAAHLGVDDETFYKKCKEDHGVNFETYAREKRSSGDALLFAKQFDVALKGDKTMLVWLGKQRLGQKENFNHNHGGAVVMQVISYNGKELEKWQDKKAPAAKAEKS